MPEAFHLSLIHIKARAPMEDPVMRGFVNPLDHINELADYSQASGYVEF